MLLTLSLLIAILFGTLPLVVLRKIPLSSALQSEGRSATGDRHTDRLKSSLMVAQIAASMILLTGRAADAEFHERPPHQSRL